MDYELINKLSEQEINKQFDDLLMNNNVQISVTGSVWYVVCDNGKSAAFFQPNDSFCPGTCGYNNDSHNMSNGACRSVYYGSVCNVCGAGNYGKTCNTGCNVTR